MAIPSGTKLGSYEVVAQIGAGGMGEVYRALDTKLGRDVAIKVLPANFTNDPERLSRFQREARMLAALNHPNIATIYGLEQCDNVACLVMELVPGETLAERVKAGPLPIEEALRISAQIAEALEAAHEKSIIHRDLKPANVKATPEGKVKVLDFGLAKAFAGDAGIDDPSNSPTLSAAATMQGTILGTAAYMSPEQARGKPVDKRTDIWAFGCVLYELLTGKQAFHGEDVTDILAAVVRAEPDWNALPAATPPKARELLRRCLQKDKTLRLRDAGDAQIEIQDALAGTKGAGATHALTAPRSKLAWVVAAAFAFVAAVMAWGWWRATLPVGQKLQPLVRLDVDLDPDVSHGSLGGADAIISPDGTRLVYASQGRLFTRRLDQPATSELPGTQGAFAPFFSPDGQWVAFFAPGKLKKISVEGGAIINLCNTGGYASGGSWGDDGNIIAALAGRVALSRVPSGGGTPQPLNTLDAQAGEITQRWPQILPGGKAVLFTSLNGVTSFDAANIDVMSLGDHSRKTLVRGGTFGRYLPSGHLVYVSRGTLFVLPFDLERLETRGTPVPLLEHVDYSNTFGSAQFEFSRQPSGSGTFVYRSGNGSGSGSGLVTVGWLDSTGKTQPLLAKPGNYMRPSISPDGERLALESDDGSDRDIWVYESRRDTMTRLTYGGGGANINSIWSPDGRYILFSAPGGISWIRSDGGTKPQPLTESKNQQVPFSITADGKRVAFNELTSGNGYAILTVTLEEDNSGLRAGKPEAFLQASFDERQPGLSPDGRWMAYTGNDSGSYQVYVRAFPDNGGKWQISNSGGTYAEWSRNGHELFFRSPDNQIMVVAYKVKGDSFVADKPRLWTERRLADFGVVGTKTYDLAPDGKRAVALIPAGTPEDQKAKNHIVFLENFFDEVRRRTATQAK